MKGVKKYRKNREKNRCYVERERDFGEEENRDTGVDKKRKKRIKSLKIKGNMGVENSVENVNNSL